MSDRGGYAWQRALDQQHDRYLQQGRALVIRTSPPMSAGRFTRKGPPDYVALLPGRTLLLDAKCYRDGFRVGDLPDHQAAAFQNAEQLGHRAGLIFPGELCWWEDFGPLYLRWRNERGPNVLVRGTPFSGTDWLEAA